MSWALTTDAKHGAKLPQIDVTAAVAVEASKHIEP